MSGHSHWAGIKHKKEAADQKRGQLFAKLLNAVTISAKKEQNPEFNPRLRSAVEKARQYSVPQENIDRAIKRAAEKNNELEELTCEAYGPSGAAIIIEAITDSKNRTIAEIKKILNDNNGKWAEPGSVRWAFNPPGREGEEWAPKFKQEVSEEDRRKVEALVLALESHDDVQKVYTNT
ncbi:MAG: YebC/PmpR family DNA-binding transcriptional regulator [Parcubacteria group bacterium]|nr:YebC/PmpR family DNA-binding transcriptional regulator [Parcubacteria group bacterium]